MAKDKPSIAIGIISIGDMGLGIARLLQHHNYTILTSACDRSPATQARAANNNIALLPSDTALVNSAAYILSIVPPRDALATAERIATALQHRETQRADPAKPPLCYLDLNAISPSTAREIASILALPNVAFVDGGIIGAPPSRKPDGTWSRPSIPLSGPCALSTQPEPGPHLSHILNTKHISPTIGSASGLKMCFASLSKGFTALAIQAFATASNLGVLEELKTELGERNPRALEAAERGLPDMCPKAYRWVGEMEEIAGCFEGDGGFERGEGVFGAVAEVFRFVAEGTELGREKTEGRRLGVSADEVAKVVGESARRRKEKVE